MGSMESQGFLKWGRQKSWKYLTDHSLALKMERGHESRNVGSCSKLEDTETDSPLEPLEGKQLCQYLALTIRPISDF